jgi:hypothetical protein
VQIRRAIALGLGVRGPEEITLVTEDLTEADPGFARLVADVRRSVGLR